MVSRIADTEEVIYLVTDAGVAQTSGSGGQSDESGNDCGDDE
jgi:hypothetical protein